MPRITLPLGAWLALSLVAVAVAPTLTTWWLATAMDARQQQAEQDRLRAAARLVRAGVSSWTDPAWQHGAAIRLRALGVVVQVVDGAGRPLFDTVRPLGSAPLPAITPMPRPAPQNAGRGTLLFSAGPARGAPLPLAGIVTLVVKAPAARHGPPLLRGTAYLIALPAAASPTWVAPLGGLAALLLTLAGLLAFLRRALLRPLAAMSRAANQIAAGDLAVHLPRSPAREVAEVAEALEGMSAALRSALDRQETLEEQRRLFVGAVAHDLRTPLFTLRAYLGGLRDRLATTPDKADRYLSICCEKADALERLVADLFAYTRVAYLEQAPRREPLELGALLRRTVESLQPRAAAKGIALRVGGAGQPCPCVGESHLLTRVAENLLDNALRYTPAGGRVCVCWRQEVTALVFTVEDSGPGIAPDDLPHLFSPLYRGDSSRSRQTGGAGLGLAIARQILLAHGGDLTAANSPSGGAVLTGTLPIACGADARPPTTLGAPSHAPAPPR